MQNNRKRNIFYYPLVLLMACIFLPVTAHGQSQGAVQQHAPNQNNGPWAEDEQTKRVALVIGNSRYLYSRKLQTPANDARDVAASLRSLHFDVSLLVDGTRDQMLHAVEAFGSKLSPNCAVVVYYSGHGMHAEGENYLLPVDFQADKSNQIKYRAVSASGIITQLSAKCPASVFVLDACHSNPFPPHLQPSKSQKGFESGLLRMKTRKGTLVAYSASEGKTTGDADGNHSPYTRQLLLALPTPEITIDQMFQSVRQRVAALHPLQVPQEDSSIGDFYLVKRREPRDSVVAWAHLHVDVAVPRPNIIPTITVDGQAVASDGDYATQIGNEQKRTVKLVVSAKYCESQTIDVELERGLSLNRKIALVLQDNRKLMAFLTKCTGTYPAFSPEGKFLVTATGSAVRLWDLTGYQLRRILSGHSGGIVSTAFSPDGKHFVTGSKDKTARVWDVMSNNSIPLLVLKHEDTVNSAEYSPDGKFLVTGCKDKKARIWDAQTGDLVLTLEGHKDDIYDAVYSPDGARIVTASRDRTAKVWNAQTGACITTLTGHTNDVFTAAYSPDGKRIVTASKDKLAKIWDADTGSELLTLTGHSRDVNTAGFSPGGGYVLTSSDDKTWHIWDASTGKLIRASNETGGIVYTTLYTPDPRYLMAASEDGAVSIWNIPVEIVDK